MAIQIYMNLMHGIQFTKEKICKRIKTISEMNRDSIMLHYIFTLAKQSQSIEKNGTYIYIYLFSPKGD